MTGTIPIARPLIGDEERAAVDRVLRSGMLAAGPEVAAFETEFAEIVGGRHCVAVNSGTSALHLGLLAAGIGPGDEVIVPSFTFAATANSVALTGATPVFVDIEPDHFCLDPAAVEAADHRAHASAIMPVHLYGHPAAMDGARGDRAAARPGRSSRTRPRRTARRSDGRAGRRLRHVRRVLLLPDQEHDLAARAAWSSPPTPSWRARSGCSATRAWSAATRTRSSGFNTRMTDLHAAIGRVQLGQARRAGPSSGRPTRAFLDASLEGVVVPPVADGATHVYHQYTIRVPGDRDAFAARLAERGRGQRASTTRSPSTGCRRSHLSWTCPQTERAAREVLSLPVHPALTGDELKTIVEAVNTRRRRSRERPAPGRSRRPGDDGPPPRPRARVRWTASSWSPWPTPPATRTAWPAAGRCSARSPS